MEVCGTHTMAIARYGLRQLLPEGVRLVCGPGCPVCVTAMADLDRVLAVARPARGHARHLRRPDARAGVARQPRGRARRRRRRARRVLAGRRGAHRRRASRRARSSSPASASRPPRRPRRRRCSRPRAAGLTNFSLLSLHKTMPLPLRALLDLGETDIDGFLLPGHVSVITGTPCYEFLAAEYGIGGVVAGFEAADVLEALLMLARQPRAGRSRSSTRARCGRRATAVAQRLLEQVFEPCDADWRGLGRHPGLRPGAARGVRATSTRRGGSRWTPEPSLEPPGCRCGEVLRGVTDPADCALFGARLHAGGPRGRLHGQQRGRLRRAAYRLPGGSTMPDDASAAPLTGERILLGHGSGGKLYRDLVKDVFVRAFANPVLERLDDAAALAPSGRIAFTTDAHVVQPLVFPGGDIGRLAVAGTVNDLATAAARPLALAAAFVIEEGFAARRPARRLRQHGGHGARGRACPSSPATPRSWSAAPPTGCSSRRRASARSSSPHELGSAAVRDGDAVILSGGVGDHAVAILAARGEFDFRADVRSDCAPLWSVVDAAVSAARESGGEEAVRFLRDPTRGGLTTVLAELAEESGLGIEVEEEAIPVSPAVRSVCGLLGYDPLTLANEGKMVLVTAAEAADAVVAAVRETEYGRGRAADRLRHRRAPPARGPANTPSARAACSTCPSENCCRGSADPVVRRPEWPRCHSRTAAACTRTAPRRSAEPVPTSFIARTFTVRSARRGSRRVHFHEVFATPAFFARPALPARPSRRVLPRRSPHVPRATHLQWARGFLTRLLTSHRRPSATSRRACLERSAT